MMICKGKALKQTCILIADKQEEFDDTEEIIQICKTKKDKQHN